MIKRATAIGTGGWVTPLDTSLLITTNNNAFAVAQGFTNYAAMETAYATLCREDSSALSISYVYGQ